VSKAPYLLVQQAWDDFYQSRPPKFRKTRRSVANRIARLGEVSVELIRRPEEAARGIQQMLGVSERGWKRRQNADLLSREFERAFLGELAQVASEANWLRLWLLRRGEEVLAAEFHLEDHGTVYGMRAQFDEAYAHYSPGSYLDFEIVQSLFRSGCACYDMGPGTAEYKLAWTDRTRSCYGIEAFNRGVYPRMLSFLQHSVIPAVRATPVGRWLRERSEAIELQARSPSEK
jgi:CelD/BcsL family acetyltransferase involved in cellulose biosynthesis